MSKSYLTKVNAETTYATLTITNGLQTEITSNTVAITGIQEELITLGIASVVNGIFTFTSQIISTSALSAEISKCFKLQGQNNLTGNTFLVVVILTHFMVLNLVQLLIYLVPVLI